MIAIRLIVDLLMHHMIEHKYTVGELRDAAYMAAVQFELTHYRQVVLHGDRKHG